MHEKTQTCAKSIYITMSICEFRRVSCDWAKNNGRSKTASQLAADRGYDEIVKLLGEHGAT